MGSEKVEITPGNKLAWSFVWCELEETIVASMPRAVKNFRLHISIKWMQNGNFWWKMVSSLKKILSTRDFKSNFEGNSFTMGVLQLRNAWMIWTGNYLPWYFQPLTRTTSNFGSHIRGVLWKAPGIQELSSHLPLNNFPYSRTTRLANNFSSTTLRTKRKKSNVKLTGKL